MTDPAQRRPMPRFPRVEGACPSCGKRSLFLGEGGYVTCARLECPRPDAAADALEGTEQKRDLFADGWREGIRQAMAVVQRADSLGGEAVALAGLLAEDRRSRQEQERKYLPRRRAERW